MEQLKVSINGLPGHALSAHDAYPMQTATAVPVESGDTLALAYAKSQDTIALIHPIKGQVLLQRDSQGHYSSSHEQEYHQGTMQYEQLRRKLTYAGVWPHKWYNNSRYTLDADATLYERIDALIMQGHVIHACTKHYENQVPCVGGSVWATRDYLVAIARSLDNNTTHCSPTLTIDTESFCVISKDPSYATTPGKLYALPDDGQWRPGPHEWLLLRNTPQDIAHQLTVTSDDLKSLCDIIR